MLNEDTCKSEVARLMRQIDLESEAAWNAMRGTSVGTAKHEFINARLERMGIYHEQLKGLVGEEEAIKAVARAIQQAGDAISNGI